MTEVVSRTVIGHGNVGGTISYYEACASVSYSLQVMNWC